MGKNIDHGFDKSYVLSKVVQGRGEPIRAKVLAPIFFAPTVTKGEVAWINHQLNPRIPLGYF